GQKKARRTCVRRAACCRPPPAKVDGLPGCLEVDAEAGTHAGLAAGERATEAERRVLTDLLGVAQRHGALATLPAETGAAAAPPAVTVAPSPMAVPPAAVTLVFAPTAVPLVDPTLAPAP